MRGKREQRRSPWRSPLAIAVVLFFAGELLLGGAHVAALLREYGAGEQVYDELSRRAQVTWRPVSGEVSRQPEATPPPWPQVDFEALRDINPEVVGWITIQGTGIDYPIVQAEDNKYYLKHLFTGEENRAGCVFLDCDNAGDFSDENSVVYGHYLNDGTMFSPLLKYKKQDYFDAHPTGWLVTPEGAYEVSFFSGFVSNVWGEAWDTDPGEGWPEQMAAKSCFSGGPTPEADDKFLTLSTCSYEFANARFLLLGVLRAI